MLVALRFLGATLLLISTIGVGAPKRLYIDRTGLLFCVASGMATAIALLSFTWSLTRINASIAAMVVAVYPLIVLVLLAWRGEKFTYRHIIRLVLGLAGVYLLIGPGGQVDLIGALLALGGSCMFAVYLVIMQWYLKSYDAQTIALYIFATVAVFTTGLWVNQGMVWYSPGWQGWLAIAVLVVGSAYLGQLALFGAVRRIGSGQMALVGPLETLLTVIWSVLFLQEHLTLLQWIGSGLILSSMLLALKRLRRARKISWRSRLRLRF